MKLIIINGPNLGNIGRREPEIYGHDDFDSYFESLKSDFPNIELNYFQSHIEGELVSKIHEAAELYDGIIFNAGAYSHSSIALRDAIGAVSIPVISVHISNIFSREYFRNDDIVGAKCKAVISGFELKSYKLAILSLL